MVVVNEAAVKESHLVFILCCWAATLRYQRRNVPKEYFGTCGDDRFLTPHQAAAALVSAGSGIDDWCEWRGNATHQVGILNTKLRSDGRVVSYFARAR